MCSVCMIVCFYLIEKLNAKKKRWMLENMQLFGFHFLNKNKIFKLNILVIIIYEMKNNGDKSLLINDVLVWFMDQECGKLLYHIFYCLCWWGRKMRCLFCWDNHRVFWCLEFVSFFLARDKTKDMGCKSWKCCIKASLYSARTWKLG